MSAAKKVEPEQGAAKERVSKVEGVQKVTFYLPEQMRRRVKAAAAMNGIPASELVSKILLDWLNENGH
jgi:hypothetical protein